MQNLQSFKYGNTEVINLNDKYYQILPNKEYFEVNPNIFNWDFIEPEYDIFRIRLFEDFVKGRIVVQCLYKDKKINIFMKDGKQWAYEDEKQIYHSNYGMEIIFLNYIGEFVIS